MMMPRKIEQEKILEELEGLYVTKSFAHMLKDYSISNDGIKKLKALIHHKTPYDNYSIEDGLINSLHVLYMGINARRYFER
jgi:hypothetical protein